MAQPQQQSHNQEGDYWTGQSEWQDDSNWQDVPQGSGWLNSMTRKVEEVKVEHKNRFSEFLSEDDLDFGEMPSIKESIDASLGIEIATKNKIVVIRKIKETEVSEEDTPKSKNQLKKAKKQLKKAEKQLNKITKKEEEETEKIVDVPYPYIESRSDASPEVDVQSVRNPLGALRRVERKRFTPKVKFAVSTCCASGDCDELESSLDLNKYLNN